MAVPDDARLVRVEELEEVTVCDFVANTRAHECQKTNRSWTNACNEQYGD